MKLILLISSILLSFQLLAGEIDTVRLTYPDVYYLYDKTNHGDTNFYIVEYSNDPNMFEVRIAIDSSGHKYRYIYFRSHKTEDIGRWMKVYFLRDGKPTDTTYFYQMSPKIIHRDTVKTANLKTQEQTIRIYEFFETNKE